MSSSAGKKKIILRSQDRQVFEVDEVVAMESQTIKHMIEDDCADNAIPIPEVNRDILAKVIEYCKKHVEAAAAAASSSAKKTAAKKEELLEAWDAEFVNVDLPTLFELIHAANYLDIKGLLELTCQRVADMIKDKTAEEVRTLFNIENDFTPEEEEAIRREIQWTLD